MIEPKNRKHLDFETWEKEALKNPEFKTEYDLLQPEFAVIEAIIRARIKKGFTQKELAEKIGTKQSVISRLESGRANPSIGFLKKMAAAMNLKFTIQLS
ncbi:MAG: hypothetical protein UR81_C0012G0003 [Candidatus Levybacteria bacterium GW2011_GWB1_35_5]|nr:MAG: hypothetical protein UR81_C0012G0003 [Candidatus Levybacteria bacterium GW2011_GWB1_35_5]